MGLGTGNKRRRRRGDVAKSANTAGLLLVTATIVNQNSHNSHHMQTQNELCWSNVLHFNHEMFCPS